MTEFLIRFVVGGSVIGSIPLVARLLGPTAAGIAVLLPVVTVLGFYFVGRDQGVGALDATSAAALGAVPAFLLFLIAIFVLSRLGVPLVLTILAAMGAWCVGLVPLLLLRLAGS